VGDGGDQGPARDAAQRLDAASIFRSQGARLIGVYDSQVAFGQSRAVGLDPPNHAQWPINHP